MASEAVNALNNLYGKAGETAKATAAQTQAQLAALGQSAASRQGDLVSKLGAPSGGMAEAFALPQAVLSNASAQAATRGDLLAQALNVAGPAAASAAQAQESAIAASAAAQREANAAQISAARASSGGRSGGGRGRSVDPISLANLLLSQKRYERDDERYAQAEESKRQKEINDTLYDLRAAYKGVRAPGAGAGFVNPAGQKARGRDVVGALRSEFATRVPGGDADLLNDMIQQVASEYNSLYGPAYLDPADAPAPRQGILNTLLRGIGPTPQMQASAHAQLGGLNEWFRDNIPFLYSEARGRETKKRK